MPGWVKLFGLSGLIVLRRRMIGVFMDPVGGCNLRCKMCYFSDPVRRKSLGGRMSDEELYRAAETFFPRALKLQIGCGAEPTLDKRLAKIISLGKKYGVPYISITTNGQLIADGFINLEELCDAGLNEVTLSMHGTRKETLEFLMPGASFEKHLKLIAMLQDARKRYPGFTVRVNFTVNSMNVEDLLDNSFWKLWGKSNGPDIVQLRPVQKIGESEWSDFNLDKLRELYSQSIGRIANECVKRGITCIAPTQGQLNEVASVQDPISAVIEDVTYCYIGPDVMYKGDFESDDTLASYFKRKRTASRVVKAIFSHKSRKKNVSKKLNYNIQ